MEDISAGGGTVGLLEEALALAGKGRLGDAMRARLWALAAGGRIAHETAHALVEMDVSARGKEAKAGDGGPAVPQASRREEIRLAWAHAVPWSLRGRMELPLATWAVLGMLIARARFSGGEWRGELSLTEQQRRLGGAGRKTVAGAVARLEKAGLVRAIRRRRNPRFNEVNIYVLEHPEAMRAASETPWREEVLPEAGEAVERLTGRPGASQEVLSAPRASGTGEPLARPEGSVAGRERPSRAPLVLPRWESKPAPGEGPRAARGAPKRAGSSPVSNSSPNDTHYHPKKESTTELQGNRRVAHDRPPSPHPLKPGTATRPSCSRQQGYKRRGPPPAGPPKEQKPLPVPLPEPVARALARAAAAELGEEESKNLDCWRIAEGLLEGEMAEFDRTAWEKARARHGTRAALAVIETALIVRIRSATEDPVRSAPAYLGGILRREPADCRPEVTLQRLAAARAAMPGAAGAGWYRAGGNGAVAREPEGPEAKPWP